MIRPVSDNMSNDELCYTVFGELEKGVELMRHLSLESLSLEGKKLLLMVQNACLKFPFYLSHWFLMMLELLVK